jgi:hypothetical protein
LIERGSAAPDAVLGQRLADDAAGLLLAVQTPQDKELKRREGRKCFVNNAALCSEALGVSSDTRFAPS